MNDNLIKERLIKIILQPRITEKTTRIQKYNQYVFSVVQDANKIEIKQAIEFLFNVKVSSVAIVVPHKKIKRTGRIQGTKKAYKKAYVTLADGSAINFDTP